jgi:hypothetical protein
MKRKTWIAVAALAAGAAAAGQAGATCRPVHRAVHHQRSHVAALPEIVYLPSRRAGAPPTQAPPPAPPAYQESYAYEPGYYPAYYDGPPVYGYDYAALAYGPGAMMGYGSYGHGFGPNQSRFFGDRFYGGSFQSNLWGGWRR